MKGEGLGAAELGLRAAWLRLHRGAFYGYKACCECSGPHESTCRCHVECIVTVAAFGANIQRQEVRQKALPRALLQIVRQCPGARRHAARCMVSFEPLCYPSYVPCERFLSRDRLCVGLCALLCCQPARRPLLHLGSAFARSSHENHQYIIVQGGSSRCLASAAARRGARPLHEKTTLADFPTTTSFLL